MILSDRKCWSTYSYFRRVPFRGIAGLSALEPSRRREGGGQVDKRASSVNIISVYSAVARADPLLLRELLRATTFRRLLL